MKILGRHIPISLRAKLLVAHMLVILMVGSLIIGLVNTVFLKELEKHLQEKAIVIAEDIGKQAVDHILTKEYLYLRALLFDYKEEHRDIIYIFILDNKDNAIAFTFEKGMPLGLKKINIIGQGKSLSIKELFLDNNHIYDIAVPIVKGELGTVHLGFSKEPILKNMNHVVRLVLAILFVALVTGTVIAIISSAYITTPIMALTKATRKISQGELEYKVALTANAEIGELGEAFNKMVDDLKTSREKIQHNYEMQTAVNLILYLSLQNISLDELLTRALEIIVSVSWLEFEPRGCIFLADQVQKLLIMKAQSGINEILQKECARLPFGKCICGETALTKEVQFVDCLDSRHEVTYAGIKPHGHYCVPILYGDELLGVINMYLKEKQKLTKEAEDFIKAVTNTLAGVIKRRQAEDNLRKAYIELKETQGHLIQAEKMKVIGSLASGVAHEVKNPLGIILQGVEYFSTNIKTDDKNFPTILGYIKTAITKANDIIRGLLDFSRVTELELSAENLNSVIDKAFLLVKYKLDKQKVEVIKNYQEGLPGLNIDKNKIEQVFVNFFLNAADAMPGGGKIIARTYTRELTEAGSDIGNRQNDMFKLGERVVVAEVEDTGTGIPQDILDKIYDPFFTTKRGQGGTGLGLAVVKSIIELHNARIEINNRKEGGAKVSLMFKIS